MKKIGICWLVALLLLEACRPSLKKRQLVVQTALSLVGYPYRMGGDRPEMGFDCSGFVQYVFKVHGITLPRTTRQQLKVGRRVFRHKFKPGDLLFFKISRNRYHVGIYIGDGKMVHVSFREKKVIIENVKTSYWMKKFYRAKRVL